MDLCDLTLKEAHEGLKNKDFSSRELTLSCLKRIDRVEDKLNAFITVTAEEALKQAQEADRLISSDQEIRSLTGIPVAIKDIFCTKGIETTAGSSILRGFVPPYDATTIKKLKAQNVVIIGKANCDAFAHGSSGENSDFGITRNPWDLERVPGGSSSGSGAAVAIGEAIFALATDTGGSIRLPASFCNLVGLKPTYGRVSRYGVIAMTSSLDCPGPIAKTVTDCALVAEVMAGYDPLDSTTPDVPVPDYQKALRPNVNVKDLKIGVPREYFREGIEPEVEGLVQKAIRRLEELGAQVVEISLPHTKYGVATYALICHSEVSSNLARYDGIRFGHQRESFGDEAKRRIMLGTFALSSGYYDQYYEKAQRVRTLIKQDFDRAFQKVDVIITPTSPTVPFKIGEKVDDDPLKMYLSDIFSVPINLAGIPALNLPCGFAKTSGGDLPVGMQIIGPQFSEELLFRVGYTYEQSCEWFKKKPKIPNILV